MRFVRLAWANDPNAQTLVVIAAWFAILGCIAFGMAVGLALT